MNRADVVVSIGCVLACGALAACQRGQISGPPDLRLGRSECAECGMLINEDRCSSGMLLERDGRREHAMYDDIGCMLDDERDGLDERVVVDRFVHDHASRQWVNAAQASFVFSSPEALRTPMGSGMIGFAGRADADKAVKQFGGRVLDYADLAKARKTWMEAKYGKPAAAPAER